MKTQMISPMKQWNHEPRTTIRSWRQCVAVALMMSALLLAGSSALQAQNPPSTYDAQTTDGFGFPGPPATMANGSSGAWNFAANLPAAYQYWFQLQDCDTCVYEADWSYDYHAGGSFTLGDGSDTFTGTFTSGYAVGFIEISGPEEGTLKLDMYFSGEWNTGLKQAGFMQLSEIQQDGGPTGSAVLNFGPAPEPGSFLLFGSGIVGLAGMLRRRLVG
jgi:hypothetical protein